MASGKASLHASCEGPLGILLQLLPGPRSSSGAEARTSGFLSSADMDLGVSLGFPQGSQACLLWRHASPLSSRVFKVVSGSSLVDIGIVGFLSRCHRAATHAIVFRVILGVTVESVQGNQVYLEWIVILGYFGMVAQPPEFLSTFKLRQPPRVVTVR